MASSIRVAKRFIVSFTKKGGLCFFITHPDLKGSDEDPIPVNPEDLSSFTSDAARYLRSPTKHRERFRRRWKVASYV
jgi:hypothetical protein